LHHNQWLYQLQNEQTTLSTLLMFSTSPLYVVKWAPIYYLLSTHIS